MTGMQRVVALAIGIVVASAGIAMASQQRPYRLSDQQLKELVNRIDTRADAFTSSFERAIDRSAVTGAARDQIKRSVKSFQQGTGLLRDRVNDRQSDTADAENVLRRAAVVDDFMARHQLDAPAQRDWQALRPDLNDLARAYGLAWNWNAVSQNTPSRVTDKQVEQLLKQLADKTGRFDKSLDRAFDSSSSDDRRGKDEIKESVRNFRQTIDRLRDRVKGRQATALDVDDVLRRGTSIDDFMQGHQLSAQAEQGWVAVRRDLDKLAGAYHVAWNWRDPRYTPAGPGTSVRHRLTGTYQLEANQGDDPRRAAEVAARSAPSDQRSRTYQSLLARLEAPELIAIERYQNSVTMASTLGERVTFEADGRDYRERWSTGSTMTTRATLEGERLVVATTGSRDSDFTATFDPMADGRGLHVTRTIDDAGLRQPVTVRSTYRRIADEARWNVEVSDRPGSYGNTGSPTGDYGVPAGTRLVAVLDNVLSTTNAREGDLFTLTTRSPSQYDGAVIQGHVSAVHASGRMTGRAGLTLNLRSIRLRNGRSYPFVGVIEEVRTPDGERVRLDREGAVASDDSQTREAVQRGAIGAALGAVIGAVAGGGKGAAIGAVIGAGGGASTVMIDGRDQLELRRGTELTITAGESWNRQTSSSVQR